MSVKTFFRKLLQKIFLKIGFIYSICKCEFYYYAQDAPGLRYVIENLPPIYIIPILKRYGVTIGKNCQIDTGLTLHRIIKKSDLKKLTIGDKVYIGHRLVLDLTEPISIGSHTAFGANCQIWTHTGDWTLDRTDENDKKNPVTIGKAVIIYSSCVISQGVNIGDYSRVVANSVVTKDIESNCIAGGIPAKFLKKREF